MARLVDTLRLFCDVATCHSFSQAARQHDITQSAASQRVGRLEQRLGVMLLDRTVRPPVLTPAGQIFFRGCRELLERYDQLQRQVVGMRPSLSGEVRVNAIYSAGIDLLNRVKEAFEQKVPQVKVRLSYLHPDQVYQAVQQRECDLGILSYPRRWPEVGIIPLRNEPMGVVCHPRHPLAVKQQVHASELNGLSMVMFESNLPLARRIHRYLKEHGSRVTISNAFDNIDTIKGAVSVTDDIAILPRRTVRREVDAGILAMLTLDPPLTRPLGIIYPKSRDGGSFPPTVQKFVDFLLEKAGPEVDLEKEISLERQSRQPSSV